MAINFPNSPNPNDTHSSGGKTWLWDGTSWKLNSTASSGIALTDFSVTTNAVGTAALSYNNAGVFSYTPPNLSGYSVTTHNHSFIGLSDTPSSFTAGKWLKVNTGGTALEWTDAPSGSDTNDYLNTASLSGNTLTLTRTGSQSLSDVTVDLSSLNPVPTNITVADESTETVCYPLFTTTATGNLAPKTGSNIKFNSASGQLEAGSFKKTGGSATEFLKADGSIDSNTYSQSTHTHTHSHSVALNDLTNVDATTNLANGKILKYDLGSTSWVVADDNASGGGSANFTGLSDTPSAHSNDKWLKSNGSALIWADAPVNLTIANNSNNRIVTGISGNDLHAEGNLTFDSDTNILTVTGSATISADLTVSGKILDKDGDSGTAGQILSSTGTQVNWIDVSSGGVTIQEEGTSLSTAATTINFTGAKVTASGTGATKTVDVATPTLTDVTTAGSSTTNNITVNDLNVDGNLTVSGTTTTIDTATLNVADNLITLNSNYSGGSPTTNGGIEVERGTAANVAIRWNETSDKWQFTNDGSNYSDIGSGSGSGTTNLGVTANGTSLTVTSDTGNNASIPAATTSAWGAMTDEMYDKLDGIALSANNYSHPNHSGDVTSTGDGATTIANNAVTYAKMQSVDGQKILGRKNTGSGAVAELTPAEVRTLINVANGAEVNVQSDWNQTTNTADDFIKNKPTGLLTSVPTLTQVTTAGSSTSNAIEVGNCTVTGNLNVDGLVGISDTKITLNSDHSGSAPTANVDVVVERGSSTDVRIRWNESNDRWTATNDGSNYFNLTDNYNDLSNTPTIPTNNNQLTNGAGYTTFNGAYSSLTGTPTIPTNNNQLTNGAGYITSSGTAANANNVKIRTDNGAAWHYLLFVDSSSDNQNQTLKLDSTGAKYYPSLNWLQTQTLQSAYMSDWSGGSGSAGQVLTSQGSGSQWSWTTPSSGGMTGQSKVTVKTSGNGTHTTQSWCKTVIAALVGAGGGGGNAAAFYDDDDSPTTGYGGGGGSGGVSFYTNNVSGATNISYSVGTGGAAQSSANCDDSPANGAAGTNTGFGGTTAGGGGGGQGVGQSGNGSGGSGGSGNLSGMAGGSGQDNNMRAVTPFFGKYGYGGRGADGSGLTGGDSKCTGGAENGENGAIIILELG